MYNTWEELENECKKCKKCRLYSNRTNVVIGTGNKNADLMFIGEGPGADEDKEGIPFVGRAGQLMNKAFLSCLLLICTNRSVIVRVLKIVKQREIDNNFKNCDYLIEFMLDKGIEHPKAIFLRIKIDNIKTDKNIGFYSMSEDDTIFNKKTQEQKIEKMLTKWWETQLKSQPKARPLETWCVGNCNDNKNNKNE